MSNTVITAVLFVVGILGAYVTAQYGAAWIKDPELYPTVFQFFVLVVLGGCVSFVYQLITQQREDREKAKTLRREKRAEERQLLLNTYNEFLGVYDKAKRVRRLLRARVLRPESERIPPRDQNILASHYDEQMETLVDAQVEFESIELRMRGNARLFASLSELDGAVTRIRRYLHATVEEYQDRRTEFKGSPQSAPLAELPALLGLIGSYGRGQAWREFNEPFQIALRRLRLAVQERSGMGAEDRDMTPIDPSSEASTKGLGAADGIVRLHPHNWEWSNRFRDESERLMAEMNHRFDTIEHVGSTAVRGIWALPVIDLLARASSLTEDEKEQLEGELAALDYERCLGPEGVELAFRKSKGEYWTHSLMVVPKGSSQFESSVHIRDYLGKDSEARRTYDSKKREVASKHSQDPGAYEREKSALIAELLGEVTKVSD